MVLSLLDENNERFNEPIYQPSNATAVLCPNGFSLLMAAKVRHMLLPTK